MLALIALLSFSGLLAVWVMYPLVIAALAAIVSRRRANGEGTPRATKPMVTVIIATRDDVETTQRRVADCLLTEYDRTKLEIVVALDARAALCAISDFGAVERNVRVVAGDQPGGKAAALNAAVRASSGDVLVFTDVHQRFDPAAIPNLVNVLQAPRLKGGKRLGAVSGSLELPDTRGRRSLAEHYWLFERWLRRREAFVHSCCGVTGAIWAMRRSLWRPLPEHLINDDMYAPMQIVLRGERVGFAHDARAFETRRHEPRQEYFRKVRTLTGVVQICSWLPAVLNPLRNPIWLQFIFHKLLRLLTPYWVAAIALWAAVMVAQRFQEYLLAAATLALLAGVATYYVRSNIIKRVWETIVSGTLLQAAAIVGTVNGVRRRWDVWGGQK